MATVACYACNVSGYDKSPDYGGGPMSRRAVVLWIVAILIMIALSAVLASAAFAGEARIIDGDTIEIYGTTYRINGIDAPEAGQRCATSAGPWRCGDEAINKIAEIAEGKGARCEPHSEDGYGRTIATCYVGDLDIGAEMVRTGFAWAFVKYSPVYIEQEAAARAAHLGIWQGDAQPAWDYRAERWATAEQTAPEGCPIKGNISKNGHIYHPPWSPWYSRTKINEAKGERWFCSEAEAVAAGWRTPHWR